MVDRKVVLKCTVGSHLYGTNTSLSDTDYSGIFLPSTRDMLGLGNCPTEWTFNEKQSDGPRNTAGDTDCKYYSLRRFCDLAAQGQPGQLELLWVPIDAIEVWEMPYMDLRDNRNLFASKRSIQPFIGFALAQAHKATIKGANYNMLQKIVTWGIARTSQELNAPISSHFGYTDDSEMQIRRHLYGDVWLDIITNDHGFKVVEIAGRKYDINLKTKTFLDNVKELVNRYGSRSQAAAGTGYDYKSLSHAYRLLSQAEEFLLTGNIKFPRPDRDFLLDVRMGTYKTDHFDELTRRLDVLRNEVLPKSSLPELPDRGKIEELVMHLHQEHLR